jgi:hypothetical protein
MLDPDERGRNGNDAGAELHHLRQRKAAVGGRAASLHLCNTSPPPGKEQGLSAAR